MVRSHRRPCPFDVARRALALILVVALSGGCSSMKPLRGAPAEAVGALPKDARVHVLLTNGERFDLAFARVEADSVRGMVRIPREGAPYYDPGEARFVAYALSDVQAMEAMQPDTKKTVILGLSGILLVGCAIGLLIGSAVAGSDWSFGQSSP